MRHGLLRPAIITLALTLASAALFAQSDTSGEGALSGRELCEQAVCGSTIFVAAFAGDRPSAGSRLAIAPSSHRAPTNPATPPSSAAVGRSARFGEPLAAASNPAACVSSTLPRT
jgi:hypothetical protein